jgi:hypothetical protein
MDAFLMEAELLLDWYPARLRVTVSDDAREESAASGAKALQPAIDSPPTWCCATTIRRIFCGAEAQRRPAHRRPRLPGRGDGAGCLRSASLLQDAASTFRSR